VPTNRQSFGFRVAASNGPILKPRLCRGTLTTPTAAVAAANGASTTRR
jgi:hypothetical protein